MAINWTQFNAAQGMGNLSGFTMPAGRWRQSATIADADTTGEGLTVELPAHGATDRGPPLKIGGRADSGPRATISIGQRCDAWFTLNGQLGAVACQEPTWVYDLVRRPIGQNYAVFNQGTNTIITGVAGWKVRVLAVVATGGAISTAGTAYISDGATHFYLGRLTATGQTAFASMGGLVFFTGGVGNPLYAAFDGVGTINWAVTCFHGMA